MQLESILGKLEGVRPRGAGRWAAKCPGHNDKNPSLSIAQGERGILLRCWTGCGLQEICAALDIRTADLFNNVPFPRGQRPIPKPAQPDRLALAFQFDLKALDHRLRSERILEAATGLDVSRLNNEELDRAVVSISAAYESLERAGLLEGVADTLRSRAWEESQCQR